MCGGGPPPGTSCDSTALTTPPVSRPWIRMTIGMPRTFIFLPPSDGIWIGFINSGGDFLTYCADWQDNNLIHCYNCCPVRESHVGFLVPAILRSRSIWQVCRQ